MIERSWDDNSDFKYLYSIITKIYNTGHIVWSCDACEQSNNNIYQIDFHNGENQTKTTHVLCPSCYTLLTMSGGFDKRYVIYIRACYKYDYEKACKVIENFTNKRFKVMKEEGYFDDVL